MSIARVFAQPWSLKRRIASWSRWIRSIYCRRGLVATCYAGLAYVATLHGRILGLRIPIEVQLWSVACEIGGRGVGTQKTSQAGTELGGTSQGKVDLGTGGKGQLEFGRSFLASE
jgi:hypothetical protein